MERHFWLVHVAVVIVAAYAVAGALNAVLYAALVDAVGSVDPGFARPGPAGPPPVARPGLRADGTATSLAVQLSARRAFNADPPPAAVASTAHSDREPPPSQDGDRAGPPDETSLPVNLVGTVVARDPADSLATIRHAGQPRLVRVGSVIGDPGDGAQKTATVMAIGRHEVLVREAGDVRRIRLWGKRDARAMGARARPPRTARATQTERQIAATQRQIDAARRNLKALVGAGRPAPQQAAVRRRIDALEKQIASLKRRRGGK